MSDIVKRLRAITGQAGDHGDVQLCMAAADEIERLRLTDTEREAVERARRAFRDMDHNDMTMQQLEDYEALCGLLERTAL